MKGRSFHTHYFVLYNLATIIGKPLTYMEIGTYNGASLCLMLTHEHVKMAIGVDPLTLPGQAEITQSNISKFKRADQFVHMLTQFSTQPGLADQIREIAETVDILFIDGAHDRKTVTSDFESFYRLVARQGFIVFDDYYDFRYSPEVHGAVNEIVDRISKGHYSDREFNIIGAPHNFYAEKVHQGFLNEFVIQII
jgi:predicted O-methyltransferase YrrM